MYLLDSSSVIHLWDNYPKSNKLFNDFWEWVEEKIISQEYRIKYTKTDRNNAKNYWRKNETVTICNQLKMLSQDGKMRMTDVVDTKQIF